MAASATLACMHDNLSSSSCGLLTGTPLCPSLQIKVHTSDVRGAGTDAAVFVNLHGASGGSSGPQELLAGPEAFERARLDTFRLQLRHVGELRKLAVGHDGSGSSSAWHLAKVVVTEEGGEVGGAGGWGGGG
jgi:hypothetical protein